MKTAPDLIYAQEFLFKESNTSQVFDGFVCIPAACNLLVADKKRGLLYIGHNDKITVLKPAEEDSPEWKIELQLPGVISKIAINCDYSYIAVAIAQKPTILIYDAHSLARNSLNFLLQIGSNKTDIYVTDIRWNPTVPTMLCTVTSDYTIGIFQLKAEEEIRDKLMPKVSIQSKLSNDLQVLCAAWSPKGKQVAVGCKNGDIIQLKPDLKVARTIMGPSPSIGEVISILWISNYQFCAAYLNNERHVNVLIVDAPKGEANATFTCYEDITYGFPDAEENISRYYFEHVPEWGLIIVGSSSHSEITVLGTADGGANWHQWELVESGRAQLPLMRTTEIFPVGLAVDKSPINKLPWGPDLILPHPVPILHILGTSGKLCSFHMVNLAPNFPVINSPPTEIIAAPLAPSQPPHTVPAEISFSMNAAVTSTPRPKQSEIVPERSKPVPITNIFGDSLREAGFFQSSLKQPVEQIKQQEEKIAAASVVAIPNKPIAPKETPALAESTKTEFKLAVDKEASSPQMAEQRASVDDGIRMRAYLQEQALFDRELRSRLGPQAWECGTDEEKKRLGEGCAMIEQFLRDLKDTTNSLSNDIAYLKALLLQSFAWLEETKSKNAASTNITTRSCRENNKIADLQRWYYYTQTQLEQVSKILDLEWSEHKAQQMKIPSLEFVYQNLLMHNKIIAKEKEKLEQISRKWKWCLNRTSMCTSGVISNLTHSMSNLYMNSPKSSASAIQGNADVIEARCKTIASKTLSFTHEKQIRLQALLTESSPRMIKSVNPSPIQDRLKATLSSLASLNPNAPVETKTKLESVMSKPSSQINKTQAIEKTKSQSNPLASLNSIVARIGTSDTNGVSTQNKAQQKPLSTAISFPTAISAKQTEKKPITIPTAPATSQPKLKQDLNVTFPSITFGTPAPKSQDVLFAKAPPADVTIRNSKESTVNDTTIPKVPDSSLFSTGILKDVLSTEYSLTKTEGIVRNLPSLATTPTTKTDAASTFSFATPNVAPLAKSSSSTNPLDTMMSFTYPKAAHMLAAAEPSVTTFPAPMQTPIELAALSLGSPVLLNLQPTDYSNSSADEKANAIVSTTTSFSAPVCGITQALPRTDAVAPSVTTIGGITISLVNTNLARKPETSPVSSSVTIEQVTTSEVKVPSSFGTMATQAPSASLLATSIFGGQSIIKNGAIIAETPTTPPASSGVVAFPSITPSFGTLTSPSTASVFSGFSNISTGAATSSAVTTVSSSVMPPFQNSLTKPMFGETAATSMPTTSAGTISFGIPATTTTTTVASIAPAFGKSSIESAASNAQFPSVQTPASTANIFEKPIISPTSTPFNTSTSVFPNMPATSSSNSIFGGMNSIFGSTPLSTTSGNIFGGNSTGFGTTSTGSIFDTNTSKSDNIFGGATNTSSASPFGSVTNNASPASPAGTNVFKSSVTNTSPVGVGAQLGGQPVFGQTPGFGAKPVFGSPPPIFGASKPVFGSGFGSPATFDSPGLGFGNPSPMQGGSTIENVMPKVFGEVAGNSTFESLATQSGGLSFGSLAQKSPESEKPAFTAGSSFSSWR